MYAFFVFRERLSAIQNINVPRTQNIFKGGGFRVITPKYPSPLMSQGWPSGHSHQNIYFEKYFTKQFVEVNFLPSLVHPPE